jgi:hypothetical protein
MPGPTFSLGQTLFATNGGVFSTGGPFILSVAVPNCFFQVDLMITGSPPTTLNSAQDLHAQQSVVWALGGSQSCSASSGEKPPTGTTPPAGGGPGTGTQPPATTVTPSSGATAPTPAPTPAAPAPTATPAAPSAGAQAAGAALTPPTAGAQHGGPLAAVASARTLPFTGMPIWLVAAIGTGFLACGALLLRISRKDAR